MLVSQMALLRADTPAGAAADPGVRLFLRSALSVPADQQARRAHGGRSGRLHAGPPEGPGGRGRAGADPGARIDDVALGGLLKRATGGGDCWLGFTHGRDQHAGIQRAGRVWDMVARSAYTQLRYSPAALAGTVIGLGWLYLVPVAATVAGLGLLAGGNSAERRPRLQAALLAAAGIAGWALMSVSYVPILRLSGAVRAAGAQPAADRSPVHGDDDQLSPAPPRRPRRRVEGTHDRARQPRFARVSDATSA